jgi:hypothetical protein
MQLEVALGRVGIVGFIFFFANKLLLVLLNFPFDFLL